MPTKWVRVRHHKTGGETDVPESAVESARKRGYRPVDEKPLSKSRTAGSESAVADKSEKE